jgi:hypothetical protein
VLGNWASQVTCGHKTQGATKKDEWWHKSSFTVTDLVVNGHDLWTNTGFGRWSRDKRPDGPRESARIGGRWC